MSRKKNITKSQAKRKSAKSLNKTQKLEKDFLSTPAELTAHFSKEIVALKQTESKLKANFAKFKIQAQKAKTRVKATAAAKAISALTKQLNDIAKAIAAASQKQAKMAALRKTLSQFEKDWSKKSKAEKVKKLSKIKMKKSAAKSSKAASIITLQPSQSDHFDSAIEDVAAENTAEAIS